MYVKTEYTVINYYNVVHMNIFPEIIHRIPVVVYLLYSQKVKNELVVDDIYYFK